MSILIKNIKQLVQTRQTNVTIVTGSDMKDLPIIENAYVLIENDTIVEFGTMDESLDFNVETVIDGTDRIVLPTWFDSHTHIVYAGNRVAEFVDRINGLSYQEIAERGGGILNSAELLQNTSEADLYDQALNRINNVIKTGTGGIEIKSGYGLYPEMELKMLRVIRNLKKNLLLPIKSTLLAAHALPLEFKNKKEDYINLIINELIPKVREERLAEYIDVFCEKGYFNLEDTTKILAAGKEVGLIPKIHVNQFNAMGGVKVAVDHGALSVDHLEELTQDDIDALKNSKTMPVALPGCSFFLGIPYTPARKIIDEGLPIALASDYNPGSTPSGNMNFVVSAACIKMKMTPEEAINAATINGAYAMGISNQYGSICRGKKANIMITKPIPNYQFLPYSFGSDLIESVIIHGEIVE